MIRPKVVASARDTRLAVIAVPALLMSCRSTPLHRKGETDRGLRMLYGDPQVGKRLAWNAAGNAETVSVSAAQRWFVSDRHALGAGLTATHFDQEGESVWGGEIQGLMRWHFTEWESTSFFWDLDGGMLLTTEKVPPMSTDFNYTFDFGPGLEAPLGGALSFQAGVQFHHLSNARGRESPENESQNELRYWIGIGWSP